MQPGNKVLEEVVLGAAKKIETALDGELERLDQLDEDDLESIRRRRLAEMKRTAEQHTRWRRQGHGQLRVIKEKEFFGRGKESERFVCILHRPGHSRLAQDFLDHVARIAESHMETLFATLDAEAAPFLTAKFKINVVPSIIFVRNGEIHTVFHGLSDLCGAAKFETARLEEKMFELQLVTNTKISDEK